MSAGGETGGMGLMRNAWLRAVALALPVAPAGISTDLLGCLARIATDRGMDPVAPTRPAGQVRFGA